MTKNGKNNKRVTVNFEQDEADWLAESAISNEMSISQFVRALVFPSAFKTIVDKKVYECIKTLSKIPREVSYQLSLQTHIEIEFGGKVYTWYERYKYIFIFDKRDDCLYPITQAPVGKEPLTGLYLVALLRQPKESVLSFSMYDEIEKYLDCQEPEILSREVHAIIEKAIRVCRVPGGYKILK